MKGTTVAVPFHYKKEKIMFKRTALIFSLVILLTGCMPSPISRNNIHSVNRAMISRSLTNTGNTDRLNNIFEKARDGKKITIAFLSSSAFIEDEGNTSTVTETVEKLKELLGKKSNIEVVKLCVAGSTSKFGNIMLEKKILPKNPDLVVLDYAVFDKHEQEEREAFESIIRTCIEQENEPQVIIFLNSKSDSNAKQDFMEQIARYYNLPIINAANALFPEISSGRMKKEEIFIDPLNYTEQGRKAIASYFTNYFRTAIKTKDIKYTMPIPMYPNSVDKDIKLIDAGNIHADNDGSFVREKNDNEFFKTKIKYLKNTQNMPFEFSIGANDICLIVPTSQLRSEIAEIYIDGEKKTEINTKGDTLFDAPQAFKIYSNNNLDSVKIEIKVKEISETAEKQEVSEENDVILPTPKKDFEFWGIAYDIKKTKK